MEIKRIIVDEIPMCCGQCLMMRYGKDDNPACYGIPDDRNEICGNPCGMKYRRSDCPLVEEVTKVMMLDELDLSVRTYNCLKRHGVRTVEQLKTMTDDELATVRNLGTRCIDEIKEVLGGLE